MQPTPLNTKITHKSREYCYVQQINLGGLTLGRQILGNQSRTQSEKAMNLAHKAHCQDEKRVNVHVEGAPADT